MPEEKPKIKILLTRKNWEDSFHRDGLENENCVSVDSICFYPNSEVAKVVSAVEILIMQS